MNTEKNQTPEFEPNIDRANENIERQANEIVKLKAEIALLKQAKQEEPEQSSSDSPFKSGSGMARAIAANAKLNAAAKK